jgi:hypothetical protein
MTLVRRALLILLCSSPALAQSPAAESLFREGRALLKQGRLADACDKFEASEMVEASVGTLLNLGDCRERLGKVATAWAAFRKAEALSHASGKDAKREAEAARRADRLEAQLPTLTIQAQKPAPGMVITRNGEKVEPGVLATAVPVDPGNYRIVAAAPGFKSYTLDLKIQVGGQRLITIPPLRAEPPILSKSDETIDVAPVPRAEPLARAVVADPPRHDTTWTSTREVSVATIAAGALALGGGAYFGLHADDLESRANKICPTATCADPTGLRLNDDAQSNATRANVLYALGGAAITTGVVLWFIGGPDEHPLLQPDVSTTTVGAHVSGRF